MEKGAYVSQPELQKITRSLVRFFKRNGFLDVSQDTRNHPSRYFYIRVKGEVSEDCFLEAAKICPPTKTIVQMPDGVFRKNAYSYFFV